MTFKQFNQQIQQQFDKMQQYKLFRLNITGQQIWEMYLLGFKPEQNPIFRDPESSTMNCNNDKHFIRRYGNIVAIDEDLNILSLFDINVQGTEYEDTIATLKEYISKAKVQEVFFETFEELTNLPYEACKKTNDKFQLGHVKTLKKYTQEEADKFGKVNTTDIYEFNHFHVFVNKQFVDTSGKSVEAVMGNYRDNKNVFQRGMQEIPLDTLLLVRDLISQGSLLNGDAHLSKIVTFATLKEQYDTIPTTKKDNWCWVNSYNLPVAKFRNELIGTLCVELAEGVELNEACKTWNKRVDPANYMKAKAPITTSQIKAAQQFVEEQGYTESFNRRFAILSDIDVSEIRHMNVNDKEVKQAGLFASVQPSVSTRHKKSQFDGIEEVSIDKFMKDILPTCTSIEAFVENRMENNLVVLTTANVKDSKPIFKWSNNYSWTYNGNLTGKSMIKEAVKTAGGKVDGILRFSISWNEGGKDRSDLDAHCQEPAGHIYYGDKRTMTGGNLDVDIRNPCGKVAVENITWPTLSKMKEGIYKFWVNQYSASNSQGFKAEIEFGGEIFSYEYSRPVSSNVNVATVTLKNGAFTIEHHLSESSSNKNLWTLETNQFHKVNLVCLSPNHWAFNNVGNKHYFFMIEGCKSDVPMKSFHNENLIGDLLEHRKVLEILADTTKIQPTNQQLAGLGFNATIGDELILKLKGSFQRVLKIRF